ncbi:hypothetical protein SAMN05443637_11417 [Pseudonocardia thermophila]|jgi:hypothetical protein|uniref:Ribbon-helix-helix protein, copG family n=2 Tax=Pseudonocardia thermophila TaxID=1848 RepID=A0A1M6W7Y9_PSETH|nr:hypothetical protein SAMN05443637_11417 [Pseudonocardia thermophila]
MGPASTGEQTDDSWAAITTKERPRSTRWRYRRAMRTERVTISLPADLLAAAREAVAHGAAPSLSAFIADALAARSLRERSLATLATLYGGPPPRDQLEEARRSLRLLPPATV